MANLSSTAYESSSIIVGATIRKSPIVEEAVLYAEASVGVFRAFFSPVIAFLGILGNVTAFVIFSKQKKKTRFYVYTISLAISDSIILIFDTFLDNFFGRGLSYASNGKVFIKIDTMSTDSCKAMEYIDPAFVFISGYLLVAFSLDRTLTVYFPIKLQSARYILPTAGICGLIGLVGLMITVPLAVSHGLYKENFTDGYYKCGPIFDKTSDIDIAQFSLILTFVITYLLPCIYILIFNSIIAGKLYQLRRANDLLLSQSSENRMEMGRVIAHLVVSSFFVGFTLPLVVVVFFRISAANEPPKELLYQEFLAHISRLFSSIKNVNYAINGYLYIFYFPFYRRQVCLWMSCGRWTGVRTVDNVSHILRNDCV